MSVSLRYIICLSVICIMTGIGNAMDVADDTIYSESRVCRDSGHTTLDEKWREIGNDGTGNCDQGLPVGWYKFMVNGKPAKLPTLCIKNKACGTVVPLRVDLHDQQVPAVNQSLRVSVCGSYPIFSKWDCCVLRRPAILHNCGAFFVYYLSPPDRCHVGYCVIGEDNLMKLHAYTAKTGEWSYEAPHPTFISEITASTTASTTTSAAKPTTVSTTTVKGCLSNERQCPEGCVPLTQSCPMTLDLNPLPQRIVHTFDTVRQTQYFTRRVIAPSPTSIERKIAEVTEATAEQTEEPITTKQHTTVSSTEQMPVSTRKNTIPREPPHAREYTTVISAITTQGNSEKAQGTSPEPNEIFVSVTNVSNTSSTSKTILDVSTNEISTLAIESSTTNTRNHGNTTKFDYVDNQNEQPVVDETYCGVILAFEFQASYSQKTNFTSFRNRLQVVFASLLNIYYVENHGIYMEGLFSWRMRYHREAYKNYTSSHVHFGRGVHNDSLYFITLFAEDIFNGVLYLPDIVLTTLLQNSSVTAYIQEEIRDFHVTFLNLTRDMTDVTPEVPPSPTPPLVIRSLILSVIVIATLLVCFLCAVFVTRKMKNKNRCMKLRRKSGQYYVKWEKVLKRDVCKGIGYTETQANDCVKGDYFVNQHLIGSPEQGCTEEEEENIANDQRRKQFTVHKAWTFPLPESNGLVFIPGVQTKL